MDTKTSPQDTRQQPSIRSFFQPRQPSYTAPPGATSSKSPPSLSPPPISQTPPSPAVPIAPTQSKTTPPSAASTKNLLKIPKQATILPAEQAHIQPLRRINALLLPVAYPDSFYHKILSPDPLPSTQTPSQPQIQSEPQIPPPSFSRTILWTDPSTRETKVIGGVVCRLDLALALSSTPQTPQYLPGVYDIYIQSLALLSPYRGMGLAAAVLGEIIEAAVQQQEVNIGSLYAHVWTQNEEGLKWYQARGFQTEEYTLRGYYRRLNPDTAVIVRRRLVPSDHINSATRTQKENELAVKPPASVPAVGPAARPPMPNHARSFQDRGPEREWNDLPEDVVGSGLLKPPGALGSRDGSAASSRSSSRSGVEARGKKKRVYPAAAFGA